MRLAGLMFDSWIFRRSGGTVSRTTVLAGVAQLVEHLICNQAVAGSSPIASSAIWCYWQILNGGIPEWPKGADCKSAGLRPTKVRILLPPL